MILFFFLLLMLAMAWGLADHFQSIVRQAPPPAPPPTRIAAPAQPMPMPPGRSGSGREGGTMVGEQPNDQPTSTTVVAVPPLPSAATGDAGAAPATSATEKP